MTLSAIDFAAERMHLLTVMTDLMQPVLWLILLLGFALASAHLLTMLGTRWGDKRVSPKALTFSIAIHLSLAVAVIACIPEYRQHILLIVEEDPPVQVQLEQILDEEPMALGTPGNSPVWEKIPAQMRSEVTRSPSNPQGNQAEVGLADNRFTDSPRVDNRLAAVIENHRVPETSPLPQAPESMPEATVQEIEAPRDPSAIPLTLEDPTAESRIETLIPSQAMRRSPAATPSLMADSPVERPLPMPMQGTVDRHSPEIDPTRMLSSIAGVVTDESPLRAVSEPDDIVRRTGPAPVPIPMDAVGAQALPSPNPGSTPAAGAPRVARTRSRAPANTANDGANTEVDAVHRVFTHGEPIGPSTVPSERVVNIGGSPFEFGSPELNLPRDSDGLPGTREHRRRCVYRPSIRCGLNKT